MGSEHILSGHQGRQAPRPTTKGHLHAYAIPTPVEFSLALDRLRELWDNPVEEHNPPLPEKSQLPLSLLSTGAVLSPSASPVVYIPLTTKGVPNRPSLPLLPLDFSQHIQRECGERTEVELRLTALDPLKDAFIFELLRRLEECRRCQWAMEMLAVHPDDCALISATVHNVVRD